MGGLPDTDWTIQSRRRPVHIVTDARKHLPNRQAIRRLSRRDRPTYRIRQLSSRYGSLVPETRTSTAADPLYTLVYSITGHYDFILRYIETTLWHVFIQNRRTINCKSCRSNFTREFCLMLSIVARDSYMLSALYTITVRLSVRHTGRSVKQG